MKHVISCLLLFFLPSLHYAQWSTSTRAESTLYVCPGFYPGIVTFDDGSSIVLGALQSYIFARKLDERGYYMWTPPVQVHYNDSSFVTDVETQWGGYVSDGDGGVIVFWYDHRGAYRNQQTGRWMNNAIYAQRVDKFGMVRWATGAVLLKGPESGLKDGKIAGDGVGGFVITWTERRFDYPGASNRSYLRSARYDQNATRVWEAVIDSSFVPSTYFLLYRSVRVGNLLHLDYYAGGNFSRIVSLGGIITTRNAGDVRATISSERDSVAFVTFYPNIHTQLKIGSLGDTIWVVNISLPDSCMERGWYFVPDGYGGAYMKIVCGDSLLHIDSSGHPAMKRFAGFNFGGGAFSDGNHGLVVANPTIAKRFNQFGQMIWPSPVTYLQNPGSAYFTQSDADKNGGIILVYWTTLGGIYAHHTGRSGRVGIITNVGVSSGPPKEFSLYHNHPNPFNAMTVIPFSIHSKGTVNLRVFDVLGREVRTIINDILEPGLHTVQFDALALSSGVYFYRLETRKSVQVKQMLLLK